MILITVIAYTCAMHDTGAVRLYADDTEKCFLDQDRALAERYGAYLSAKGFMVDLYERTITDAGSLDIKKMVREDALAKLTHEEREALGL